MSYEEIIQEIPLDLIDEPELPARATVDEEKLLELRESIREVGQRDPIKVVKVGNRYKILDGHMRYLAMKNLGKTTIKAIVETPRDTAEALAWRLHSNIYVPTAPYDEAVFFKKVIEELNLTIPELAQKLHRSENYIRSRLEILNYPEDIQKSIIKREISLGVAKQLAKIPNEQVRKNLLSRAIRDGLSEARAKIWVKEFSKVEAEAPPPPPQQMEEKIKEMDEYLISPCEVCGGKIKIGDLATISGHTKCIEMLKKVIEYEKEISQKEERENTKEKEGQETEKV